MAAARAASRPEPRRTEKYEPPRRAPARRRAPQRFTLFDTPAGTFGIAWSEGEGAGITYIQYAEGSPSATAERLLARTGLDADAEPVRGGDAPPWVRDAIERVVRHLEGTPQDLASLRLDMRHVTPFRRRVYEAALSVGPGEMVTYGDLALRVGSPGASRAVGQAMANNPFVLAVPCHRVVAAGGASGGFSAHGGVDTKAKLLALEGRAWGAPQAVARPGTAPRKPAARPGRRDPG